jgi:hypothetical protein
MHDIKYFILNKNNRTIQEGAKTNFRGQITESIIKKYYFSKSRGHMPLVLLGSAPAYIQIVIKCSQKATITVLVWMTCLKNRIIELLSVIIGACSPSCCQFTCTVYWYKRGTLLAVQRCVAAGTILLVFGNALVI